MRYRAGVLAALAVLAVACSPAADTAKQETSAVTSTQVAAPASTANEAPPMENGAYTARGICFGEGGCPYKNWRALGAVEVRERADTTSPVIATLAAGDWVEAMEGFHRFVPRRGVVRTPTQGLAAGDVVYLLQSEGEGFYTLWRRGEIRSWEWPYDDDASVAWDPLSDRAGPTLGWWVRVKLANGKSGWVRDPNFDCMGPLSGSANCRG